MQDMSDRTFTLDEAQALLPILETLLRRAIDGKQKLEELDRELNEELDSVRTRIMLDGGCLIDLRSLVEKKIAREKSAQQVKDAVAEIDSIGVQVKDLDIGLLDFPWVQDPEVLLCWKLGEKEITHWHNTTEGFRGRKPIDNRIAGKKRKPM